MFDRRARRLARVRNLRDFLHNFVDGILTERAGQPVQGLAIAAATPAPPHDHARADGLVANTEGGLSPDVHGAARQRAERRVRLHRRGGVPRDEARLRPAGRHGASRTTSLASRAATSTWRVDGGRLARSSTMPRPI